MFNVYNKSTMRVQILLSEDGKFLGIGNTDTDLEVLWLRGDIETPTPVSTQSIEKVVPGYIFNGTERATITTYDVPEHLYLESYLRDCETASEEACVYLALHNEWSCNWLVRRDVHRLLKTDDYIIPAVRRDLESLLEADAYGGAAPELPNTHTLMKTRTKKAEYVSDPERQQDARESVLSAALYLGLPCPFDPRKSSWVPQAMRTVFSMLLESYEYKDDYPTYA
jgi:hypothetical protein